MPINSFDDYPMTWSPARAGLHPPLYRALAVQLERARAEIFLRAVGFLRDGIDPNNVLRPVVFLHRGIDMEREIALLDANAVDSSRAKFGIRELIVPRIAREHRIHRASHTLIADGLRPRIRIGGERIARPRTVFARNARQPREFVIAIRKARMIAIQDRRIGSRNRRLDIIIRCSRIIALVNCSK